MLTTKVCLTLTLASHKLNAKISLNLVRPSNFYLLVSITTHFIVPTRQRLPEVTFQNLKLFNSTVMINHYFLYSLIEKRQLK